MEEVRVHCGVCPKADLKLIPRIIADVETFAVRNDRTLFSRLTTQFETAIVDLLQRQEVSGISTAALQTFQESYASAAFRCRYPNCNRSSIGFASQELRTQHETVHFQRVYCKVSTCQFSRIGFARKSALSTHTRTHHAAEGMKLIPSQVRRSRDGGEEGVANGRISSNSYANVSVSSTRMDAVDIK